MLFLLITKMPFYVVYHIYMDKIFQVREFIFIQSKALYENLMT